jgi:RNA polymerase sigma-70 factor, ECF subfamily
MDVSLTSSIEAIAPAGAGEWRPGCSLEQAARVFVDARPGLLRIASRILRDPLEAEDILQDAWIRWQRTDRAVVLNAQAFLTTMTTRLALNQAQCAWRRRETPAGTWFNEPTEPTEGPERDAVRENAVELALLVMLASLSANQLAAYVLRESFDYPYDRIAELLQLDPANCRQLVRRAKHRLASERRRPVGRAVHKSLLEAFIRAARHGQVVDLENLLVPEAAARVVSPSRGIEGPETP